MGKAIGKGVNAVGSLVGLGGKQEDYYQPTQRAAKNLSSYVSDNDRAQNEAKAQFLGTPGNEALFGDKGLASQLAQEQNNLATQGYGLTQGDQEAYGQTSGNIARLFGQQDQQAAQSLARRGLASAGSGAAGAAFSGLAGNKNEMLAKAQTDIAQKRMADTQSRLQNTRQLMAGLGHQATGDIGNMRAQKLGELQADIGGEGGVNAQNQQSAADKRGAKGKGLFDAVGSGVMSGISGGLGAAGGGLGASLFGGGGAGGGLDRAGGKTTMSSDYLNMK